MPPLILISTERSFSLAAASCYQPQCIDAHLQPSSDQIEFKTAIRGHHVYKQTWTPSLGEILQCKKDNRQEALDHDEHAVGVYKFESDDAETMLVGHVPIELSMFLSRFLKASEKNAVEVKVCGKRRREVGLVIPGHYKARTKSRSHCKILDRELNYNLYENKVLSF